MKKILLLLLIPSYLVTVAGFTCNESEASTGEPGQASFWKKSGQTDNHYLYIDNVEKGLIPFIPDSLATNASDDVKQKALSVILKPGRYDILVKDKTGRIFCEGSLFLKRTQSSKEINSSWENDNCMVRVIYHD